MTNREAAEAFLQGKEGHSANLHSIGSRIYSYAEPIAAHVDGEVVVSDATGDKRFSMTTSHHVSRVGGMAAVAGFSVRTIPHGELQRMAGQRVTR